MARGDSRKGHLGNVVGGGRESFTPAVCRRLELLRAIDGAVPLVGAFPEVPHSANSVGVTATSPSSSPPPCCLSVVPS